MIKFRSKTIFIKEELTPEQTRLVDSWGSNNASKRISDHVFGNNDRITIPLEQNNDTSVVPHPDVQKHLEQHGYYIHDYKV